MELKDVLKKAITGEIEGRELYKTAAEKTDDAKAKEVFEYLAEEEEVHVKALSSIYKSYTDDKDFEISLPDKILNTENAGNPIFSNDFKKRLKGKHFEISALSIGMKLEMDSYKFYAEMAKQTEDKKLKDFFIYLSDWEKDHYDVLNTAMEDLQDEYFEANSFAQF